MRKHDRAGVLQQPARTPSSLARKRGMRVLGGGPTILARVRGWFASARDTLAGPG